MKRGCLNVGKGVVGVLLLALVFILARLGLAGAAVSRTSGSEGLGALPQTGVTTSLTILPLYEEAAAGEAFESGHGVSYLITTDVVTILMDLGHNPERRGQVPMVANMERAGVSPEEIDLLFISHNHPDHMGGLWPQPAAFYTDGGESVLDAETAYAPVKMTLGGAAVQVAERPEVIAPGVATLGRMPFVQPFPFWLWSPLGYEQALAVNVAGKGVVLITGCGHPTLEKLIGRAEALYAQPVVGIVGGLHYEGIDAATLQSHVDFLAERRPQLVALSPHDDGPEAIDAFAQAFPTAYRYIRVGEGIYFGTAAAAGSR